MENSEMPPEIPSESALLSELGQKYESFTGWEEDILPEDLQALIDHFPEYKLNNSEASQTLLDYADLKKIAPAIKMEHAVALHSYTKKFAELNAQLREGTAATGNLRKIQTLNEALDFLPDYVGTVYRGIQAGVDDIEAIFAEYEDGSIVEFKSFLSTSEKIEGSRGGAINYVIDSKHGKRLAGTGLPGEYEVLFKTNSRFRIIEKQQDEAGKITIHLEEVSDS
jgi:hypothetical protein